MTLYQTILLSWLTLGIEGQGRPPCRVLKNPDQRKTNLSEKSALVNLLLCDFWIWFGF